MKRRTNKKRSLRLKRTTVRKLEAPELEPVVGGGYGFTCNRDNCGNTQAL